MKKSVYHISILLMAAIIFTLGIVTFFSIRQLHSIERAYTTMPLRSDLRGHKELSILESPSIVRFLDKDRLLYVHENVLVVQSIKDSLDRKVLYGHTKPVQALDVSPNGKTIVSSSEDGTLRLWDVQTGSCLQTSLQMDTLSQPTWLMLMDVHYIQNGRKIITADMDGIKTWSARNCRLLSEKNRDYFYMRSGVIGPTGKTCCAYVTDGGFELMDTQKDVILYNHKEEGRILCYSPDGEVLLFANEGNGNMMGWDVSILHRKKGKIVAMIPFLREGVPTTCAAFSPDGKEVVSASEDGMIYVWNAKTGTLRESFPSGEEYIDGVCFDMTGTCILAFRNISNRVHIWGPREWMI